MKRIMNRAFVTLILCIAFVGGLLVFCFRLVTQSSDWVQQPYNGHMTSTSGMANAGSIYDRDGNLIAYSDSEGTRRYHEDLTTRMALLHVLGDNELNISTAVQSNYRTRLTGYNYFLGMGLPPSLRTNSDLKLTINTASTRAAFEALGGRKGACVVYNYKTGEILCSTSSLSFDPENPPEITAENEAQYDGVYLDNVTSSTFTPGSTFKIVTATSAIEHIPNIYEQTFECTGEYEIEGSKITCEHAHGTLTFEEAFANSCNIAFAQIANQLGKENMTATAEEMGFNKQFSIGDVSLAKSSYDVTNAGENELAWSGIGQQNDLANPMHMAMLCGAVANAGKAANPVILSDDASLLSRIGLSESASGTSDMLSPSVADATKGLMRTAANRYYNVSGLDLCGLNYCAKTGTAEVGEGKEPTAWFVGFIEDDAYPYAFAAVVVEGGYGIAASTPVVQAALAPLVYH